MLELEPSARGGNGRILGTQIVGHLLHDVVVATRFELGLDNPLRVCVSGIAEQSQALGRLQPQQPIASGGRLEAKLLIVLEAGFELFPTVSKGGHLPLTLSDAPERNCVRYIGATQW